MSKAAAPVLQGDVLTVQPYRADRQAAGEGARSFVIEVADEAASRTLLASLPLLDRLLAEKTTAERGRRMEEMVDFMAARMLMPSSVDLEMAKRMAMRHARLLNEFGWFSAEQLADANGSQASHRAALADNWRKRRQVFCVPHPDKAAREPDVYPAFQFEDGRPIKAVQQVLEAFAGRKEGWKLALWFTSNNGALPNNARPVDLLIDDPQAVIEAARRDARGSGA